jgi:hypothetical protein
MGALVELLFNPYSRASILVNARSPNGVSSSWAEWEKWRHKWEVNKGLYIVNIYTNFFLSFLSDFKSNSYTTFILWSGHGDQNVHEIKVY